MSALTLRIIACLSMLLDHIGFQTGIPLLRYVGRLAFPLFVFLMVNGYFHTQSRPRYALRMAVFAIVSQIPFTLFGGVEIGTTPVNLNVFFTLLLGMLCIWATDCLWKKRYLRWAAIVPTAVCFGLLHFGIVHADYGAMGILMAMTMWLFYGASAPKRICTALGTLVAVYHPFLIACAVQIAMMFPGRAYHFTAPTQWQLMQGFSLLALVPIFSYNGKRGAMPANKTTAKAVQLGFYVFYPAHMLLLWLIFRG